MMNTIRRYILWELFYTFFFAFFAMTLLLILGGLIQQAIANDVPLSHVVQMIPYVVVEMSRFSLPMTLLLTVTTFFARMSGNNEIIALKSLGSPSDVANAVGFLASEKAAYITGHVLSVDGGMSL